MPPAVRRTALLLAAEGAALAVLGLGYGTRGVLGAPENRLATVLAGVMALLLGVGLLSLAQAVSRTRGWSRSPAVTLQLLALPVGIGLAQNGVVIAAALVLALAAGVLYHFWRPDVQAAFSDG